jgi:hypothetical protein
MTKWRHEGTPGARPLPMAPGTMEGGAAASGFLWFSKATDPPCRPVAQPALPPRPLTFVRRPPHYPDLLPDVARDVGKTDPCRSRASGHL